LPFKQDVPWYKSAIIYHAHVRTFYNSDGGRHWRLPWPAEVRPYFADGSLFLLETPSVGLAVSV
jgi:hypothetical protein